MSYAVEPVARVGATLAAEAVSAPGGSGASASEFRQTMAGLRSAAVPAAVRDSGGGQAAAALPAPAAGPSALGDLMACVRSNYVDVSRRIAAAGATSDPQKILEATVSISNSDLANTFVAKVVGKAVQGVETLTRLS
jgi:hypothetical protein